MENFISELFTTQLNSQSITAWLFLFAFIGGVISSLSPCSLGLLPIVIGYVGGYSNEEKQSTTKLGVQIFSFILGLSAVLTSFGVVSALTGKVFGSHAGPMWILIMASLIMVMGLNLLEVIELPMPTVIKKFPKNDKNTLFLYPAIIGGTFALASSPCSTPILAGIIAISSIKANLMLGAGLLFLFSLGQGVILLLAGIFTSLFKKLLAFRTFSTYFMKANGVVLVAAAILIYLKILI